VLLGDNRYRVICCRWLLEGSDYVFLLQGQGLPCDIVVVNDGYGGSHEGVGALNGGFDKIVFQNLAHFALLQLDCCISIVVVNGYFLGFLGLMLIRLNAVVLCS